MTVDFYEHDAKPNKNKTRTPGVLLRRVSLLYNQTRPDIASISNNYGNPLHGNATQPPGTYCNYTPVSDDSLIKIAVSLYVYRGNSVSGQNGNLQYNYVFRIGSEFTGRNDYNGGSDNIYTTHRTVVPSWGAGQTRRVAFSMTNNNGSGYYRANISYNQTFTPTGKGPTKSSLPKLVIEEFSPTEPLSPAMMSWNEKDMDF